MSSSEPTPRPCARKTTWWSASRRAEYLTFVATALLLPLEIYEIIHRPTVLKGVTLALNLAVVLYLVWAKRLFGLRGGERAQRPAPSRLRMAGPRTRDSAGRDSPAPQ